MAYDKLGSGALLTALAISVSAAHAEEVKTEKTAAEKEQQAVELIKIHGGHCARGGAVLADE